jgi:hypothetical protein
MSDDIEIAIPFSGTREEVVEWIEKHLPSDIHVRVNVRAKAGWYR